MAMRNVRLLDVLLHGESVGTLTLLSGDQTLFAFNEEYIADADRPTLSLSFKGVFGDLLTDLRPTRTKIPPFFSNLLPEGPMRRYLAERAGVHPDREFFLLGALGADLPGALRIEPADAHALADPEHPSAPADAQDRANRKSLRFSLAGVQLKFSAIMEATGGLTVPADGAGGSWIVKLPSTLFPGVPENEFSMMTLAGKIGIEVPTVKLVELGEIDGLPRDMATLKGPALAVERFDRSASGPVHIEDFAQVFGVYPERKYEKASYRNIANVLWAEIGEAAIAEFVRRLVFNALIGNADMHLKNWSLIYPDRRTPRLAPGYDFVSTIAYLDDADMALTLGRSKKMNALSWEQLSYFAEKARLPEKLVLDTAAETVERFHDSWNQDRSELALSKDLRAIIEAHVKTVPIS